MTQTASLRSSPPSSFGLVALREPQTRWTELTVPLDTEAQKTNRQRGKILALTSLPLFGATIIAFLISGTPKKVTVSLGFATIVSLVTGVSVWFFNSAADEKQLLTQRADVGKNIQKRSLGSIREKYRDEKVISNDELNQWMRYFLHSQSFDVFVKKQSDHISELTLDLPTKDLIRAKGLYFLRDPACTTNLSRFGEVREVLAMGSFTEAELEDLRKLVEKARVTLRAVDDKSYGAHYNKLFYDENISEQKRESDLKGLPMDDLPFYAWLFSIYAWESELGIEAIENKYKYELVFFKKWLSPTTNCFDPHLYHYIADFQAVAVKSSKQSDREVSFEGFIVKNGEKAIQYIRNENTRARLCERFLAHLIKMDLGFVKAHDQFAVSFEQFGDEAAKKVDKALLQHEWDTIDTRTSYIDIRTRTGLDNIPDIRKGNNEEGPVILKLSQCFLELTPKDLISPEYQVDRAMLGITDEQLRTVLMRKWKPWTLKQILELHGDAFVKSLSPPNPLFTAQQWETHISSAIQGQPIEAIFEHYSVLFNIGVLKASYGHFAAQIREMQVKELRPLLERYGSIIFGQKLLEKTDHKVVCIVAEFIHKHADYYLGGLTVPVMELAGVIQKFILIPDAISSLIEKTNENKASQKTNSEGILKEIDVQHEREMAAINERTEEEIQKLDTDILSKQTAALKAEKDLVGQQSLLESCAQEIKDLETREARAKKTAEELEPDLSKLRNKKKELDKVSGQIQSLGNEIGVSEGQYGELRVAVQCQADNDSHVKKARQEFDALMKERSELEMKIQAITEQHAERDALVRKMPETPSAVSSKFSGSVDEETEVLAAYSANRPIVDPTAQDQAKLRMLNTILGYKENSLEAASTRINLLNTQINEKKEEETKLVKDFFDNRTLRSKREEITTFQQRQEKLQGQHTELLKACEPLASSEAASQRKQEEWREIESTRSVKESDKKRISTEIANLTRAKDAAANALATARSELEQKRARVRKKQQEQKQTGLEKLAEAKKVEKKRYDDELLRIIKEAKDGIEQIASSFSL